MIFFFNRKKDNPTHYIKFAQEVFRLFVKGGEMLKNGKKPTIRQCNLIKTHSDTLSPKDWLVVKYTAEFMEIVHKGDKFKTITIRR